MIYDSLFDDYGDEVNGRKTIFLTAEDDGNISSITSGFPLIVNRTGFVYVVDEVVVNNIYKFEVINGNLRLREGETLDEPVKSEKELKREELLRQIAELDAAEDEPADTEEQTDTPLLDYTDKPSE